MWVTNKDDIIYYVNKGMGIIAGIATHKIIGSKVLVDFSEETLRYFIPFYLRAKETLLPIYYDGISVITPGGRQSYQSGWLIPKIKYSRFDGMICTVEDVTEYKVAEKEKNKLEAQLRHAQKMEAIGTLAGGIAHDFNNILFPIMGYSDLIMTKVPKDSEIYESLKEISKASSRARELVTQILTIARQEEKEKQPLKIQPIIREALKLLFATLPSTIQIRSNIDENCGHIMGDPTQVHQIIMNLCTNAYHAMRENGGMLEVILKTVKLNIEDLMAFPDISPGIYLKLSVKDTGIGIDKKIVDRIFEPYFTTKSIGEGTGLGLSVVHGIVKQINGHITVDSEIEAGTTFNIYIPVINLEKKDSLETISDDVIKGSERILVVDDEKVIVDMLKRMLEYLGYKVTTQTSSDEALKAFQASPDYFDIVITDMTMPYMTGTQLAQKIMEVKPGIPIILCTGYNELISEEKSEQMGIRGFLMKPIQRNELTSLIRKVLS
ncbi:MAG: response regulator [Desulfobacterales bacterium]|nr:response regulator [Desulfobacterales bacterium]